MGQRWENADLERKTERAGLFEILSYDLLKTIPWQFTISTTYNRNPAGNT